MYTMRPAEFEYHRPTSVDEAISLLGGAGETRPLAGGHSLLPLMKLRLSIPDTIVDLGRIPELTGIEREGDAIRIGALTTHVEVAESELVRSECPVLAETAGMIGDPQVRNRGTVGGSVAHADPGADYPTVLTALGATVVARGGGGEREIAADEFFLGIFTTSLGAGELVTSVRVPVRTAGTGAAYAKHPHPASGYAVVGVAAAVTVTGGTCSRARVTVGGVTGTPVDAAGAAESLVGASPSQEAVATAAGRVSESFGDLTSDTYASGEYRAHLAQVLAKRALTAAFERAR